MIELEGSLPAEVLETLKDLNEVCLALGIDFLLIGATARDLVLVHAYGAKVQRATEDIDFAVNVQGWEDFYQLKTELAKRGYEPDPKMTHRLQSKATGKEIDVVPFGGVENSAAAISWPPEEDFQMVVLGFADALDSALDVKISSQPEIIVPVASPEGICLLKLVAWIDRESDQKREKDALDIRFLIESYSENPQVHDALYDEGYMEQNGFDIERASAMKLGREVSRLASAATRNFIQSNLFGDESAFRKLTGQMTHVRLEVNDVANFEWLSIFRRSFQS